MSIRLSAAAARPCVMICEDEALVAEELAQTLEDLGYETLGPYATQREALRALRRRRPDLAIIDVELADGACTRLAAHLQTDGVDFAVLSGLATQSPPPEFAGVPWLLKPVSRHALRLALGAARAPATA